MEAKGTSGMFLGHPKFSDGYMVLVRNLFLTDLVLLRLKKSFLFIILTSYGTMHYQKLRNLATSPLIQVTH